MKNKICKRRTKKITSDIVERYELKLENGVYVILCTEYDKINGTSKCEEIRHITADKRKANKLYALLVRYGACAGTIKDIIEDQMC